MSNCKKIFFISVFSAGLLFAQNSKTGDGAAQSSVSMPTMPTVSQPSVGGGFYSPGRSDFYTGRTARGQNQSAPDTGRSQSADRQNSSAPSNEKSQNADSTLTTARNLNAITKSVSSMGQLTADDISSMSGLGILGPLSGLLGRGGSNLESKLIEAQNMVTASTADSETLRQILSELSELKNQVSNGANSIEKSSGENAFSNIEIKKPRILRFIVNGYDILATCKKIYFSETETDGTFLLTGDRKYMSEGRARGETFYFYFHASGSENGIAKYVVTPAVSQDYENEYSYLYQLTQKNELVADRTGNLVTLRVQDGAWNMDLLISLDK